MGEKLRIGVIGVGNMGSVHVRLLRTLEEVEVPAIADINRERLTRVAQAYKIPRVYEDYREMLEKEELDGVVIATPPSAHVAPAIEALRRGLHVLLEKPMAATYSEAFRVYEEARKHPGRLMIAFSLRFHLMYRELKNIIDDELGRPLFLWHAAMGRVPPMPWIRKRSESGGMVNENGVHVLYVFCWYAGRPKEVFARIATYTPGLEIEDSAVVVIKHESGALSTLMQTWASAHPHRRWGIVCERGSVSIDGYLGGKVVIATKDGKRREIVYPEAIDDMYRRELEHFVHCIRTGERPVVNEEDGILIQKIVTEAWRAAEEGEVKRIYDRQTEDRGRRGAGEAQCTSSGGRASST